MSISISNTSTSVQAQPQVVSSRRIVTAFAYIGLLVSISVYGFWQAFIPGDTTKLLLAQSSFLLALFVLTFTWQAVRALRGFFLIALVMSVVPTLVQMLVFNSQLGTESVWGNCVPAVTVWFGGCEEPVDLEHRRHTIAHGFEAPRFLSGERRSERHRQTYAPVSQHESR